MINTVIIVCIAVVLLYVIFNTVKYIAAIKKQQKILAKIPRRKDPHPLWGNLDEVRYNKCRIDIHTRPMSFSVSE